MATIFQGGQKVRDGVGMKIIKAEFRYFPPAGLSRKLQK
jgi:hypothetical protein